MGVYMSSLEYAKSELGRIYTKKDLKESDGINKMMYDNILQLIKVFSKQGHSGYSASYCREMFYKLSSFKPLGPLTSDKKEWMAVEGGFYQSNRNPACFSTDLKYYYDLDEKNISKWKIPFIKNHKGHRLRKLK